MEGPGLISINEDEKHYKYFLSPEVRLWVEERNKKYSLEKIEDFDESVSEEFFQRRYGRYTYQKDTRQIKGLTQSYQLKSEKDFVTSKFYGYVQDNNENLDVIPSDFISLMGEQFGFNQSVVRAHLSSEIKPNAIDSHLRELSVGGGGLNAINFEKYLSSWLKKYFQIKAKHIGQLTGSKGETNADVLVWDLKLSACGLMDAKAYSSGYSLPLADRLKMMHVYQYSCLDMRSGEEELQCVGYVCGTIGNNANLEHHLEEIKSTIGKPAFMIQIDELIDVKNKYDGSPATLFDFFKKGGVLDSTMFNSAV